MLFDISSRVPGRAFEFFVDGQPLESAEPLIRLALEIQWPLCVRRVTVRPFSFVVNVRGSVGGGKFNADAVIASAVTGAVYSAGVSFNMVSVSPSIPIGLDAIQFVMELHGLGISRWREQAKAAYENAVALGELRAAHEREVERLREQRAQSMALAEQATAKLAEVRKELDAVRRLLGMAERDNTRLVTERDEALVKLREALRERNAYARDLVIERDEVQAVQAVQENANVLLRKAVAERDAYVRDLAIAKAGWRFQVEKRGKERESLSNALATLQAAMAENQALRERIDDLESAIDSERDLGQDAYQSADAQRNAVIAERDMAQAELNGIRGLLADNYWLQNASTGWRIDYWLGEESPWRALFGDEQRGILDERQFVTLPEAVAWLEATGREAQAEAERAAVVGE